MTVDVQPLASAEPTVAARSDAASRLQRVVPWLLLGAFAAQLAIMVRRHEAWFDEAQAWLVARDSGLVELLTVRLRYEGTPGLWHLILTGPAKIGLPYQTMAWIAAAAAVGAAALVLWRAPFPLWAKAALVFSYTVAYQYAAVARSYALMPLLLFGLAVAWPRRFQHVGPFAVLLALLANVSVHGFFVAAGIGAVHAAGVIQRWPELDGRTRVRQVLAGLALGIVAVVLVWLLVPPPGVSSGGGAAPWRLDPAALLHIPRFLDLSLTGTTLATLLAVLLTSVQLWRRRALALWVLPSLGALLLSALKYHMPHHEGIPFLVWIFALWVSFGPQDRPDRGRPRLARPAAQAGLAIVLAVNLSWWLQTYRHDFTRPYSGSTALAAYLETLPTDSTVYMTSWHTLGAAPYFTDNPFDNYNDGNLPVYWPWTPTVPLRAEWEDIQRDQPDVVVWGIKFDWQQQLPAWEGYRQVHRFDGEIFAKSEVVGIDSFVVYERGD